MNRPYAPRLAVLLAAMAAAGAVHAAAFGTFDPRSMALGGTGVSSATSGNAGFFNPALLAAAKPKDRFSFDIMAGARISDQSNLRDDVDRLKASGNKLTSAVDQFNLTLNPVQPLAQQQAAAGSVALALEAFRTDLAPLNNKVAEINLFVAPVSLGVPGKTLGWGLIASARTDIGARLVVAPADNQLMTNFSAAAQTFATTGSATDLATLLATFGTGTSLDDPNLQSRLDVRGSVFGEIGIPLAHEFQTGWPNVNNLALGITPKFVKVMTFDYSVNPQSADITADKGRRDYTGANFDFGVAKELGSGAFKVGLVAKNMVPHTYLTALGNKIELKPQWRAGVSHHTGWTTVAFDLDLSENPPTGLDKPTRYAGIGAEFDAWGWAQLRLGYRTDLSGNYKGKPSVGLGVSIFGLHVDAAVSGSEKEEATAALQLGFRF
jgi:F plasmid transfer operon, TraF, protein